MADDARNLRATDISNEIVCLLFPQVLPEECDVFRQMIEREKEPLNIDELVGERARFVSLEKGQVKIFRDRRRYLGFETREKWTGWSKV